jgi:hypothetical protein
MAGAGSGWHAVTLRTWVDCTPIAVTKQSVLRLGSAGGREGYTEEVIIVYCRDWTRTIFLRGPDEDYTMTTKGRLLERLHVILAGRAAEEVLLSVLDCARMPILWRHSRLRLVV